MPGIFGIISSRPQDAIGRELDEMSKSISMEPFYSYGRLLLADIGVYIGWSCHKGSFSDCMPVTNEKGDIILIYCGENFKDIEEIDELKGRKHRFIKTNASYLVHMYEEWGENFLVMLNGRFHGILIDTRSKKTILFNDRYGMQRVYYYEGSDAFYFSAESKAILKIFPKLRQLETGSLAEFFAYNCVLGNRSLFKNICLLPGGSSWTFHGLEKVDKKIYFEPSILEDQPFLEKEFLYEKIRYTLGKILQRYLRSEGQIGVRLTGNMETLIILSNAQYGPEKLSCYTLGGMCGHNHEMKVARKVAEAIGQTLQVIPIDDYFKKYPELAEKSVYISDGAMDVTGAAELYLSQITRQIAPIRLSSDYGGELLRKEELIHVNNLNRSLFNPEFQNILDEAHEKYKELILSSLTPILSMGIPWRRYGRLSIEQSQMVVRTPFIDNDFVKLLYRTPDKVMNNAEISLRLIKDGKPLLAKIGSILREKNTKLEEALRLVDTFHKTVFEGGPESCSRTPNWMREVTSFLNYAMLGKVNRRRYNFHPFKVWHRDKPSSYVKGVLLDGRSKSRPYINKQFLEHIVEAHTKGAKNYANEIQLILTVELVHRLFIEN